MLIKKIFLLICVISCHNLYAQLQQQSEIDSLVKALPLQKEDTNKVNMLYRIADFYKDKTPDEALKAAQQGMDLADRLGWQEGKVNAYDRLGVIYLNKHDYRNALKYDFLLQGVYEANNNKQRLVFVICNIGIAYVQQNDFPGALEYFNKAMKIAEGNSDKKGIARVSLNTGNLYFSLNDFPKALEYYMKSAKLNEEINNTYGLMAALFQIGSVYKNQSDYVKALDYYTRALKMMEDYGHKGNLTEAYLSMGDIYAAQKRYTKALTCYFKSFDIAQKNGFKANEAVALSAIAGEYILIVSCSDSATKNKDLFIAAISDSLGDGVMPKDRNALIRKATFNLNETITIATEVGFLDQLPDAFNKRSIADSLAGDYRNAYRDKIKSDFYADSVSKKQNYTKIARMEMEGIILADSLRNEQDRKIAELKLRQQRNYSYLGAAGIVALIVFSFFIFTERRKSDKARQRSDDLLLNILPSAVAAELKDKGSATAKNFEKVTVLFTDFVDFTRLSERMNPQQLIDELHICFKAFDEITAKYNIEKIKTIGDSYLAVAGLPTADPRHAYLVVCAAKEINAFMRDRAANAANHTFGIRIGIHSGSVVAGIVGIKKFAYDIWGDTVNTAARMEQKSEPGRINISETTYELVKEKFSCEYRGEIDAKGKGMMKMYFVF